MRKPTKASLIGTAALAASVAASGCGTSESAVAGNGLDARDRPLAVAFDTLYTVGAIEGESWETFGTVNQVAFDSRGRLYIFDQQNGRIVVVGPDGSLVREVGKKGGGPGEFQNPLRMAVASDGSIAVSDFGVSGFTLFDAQGEFTRTVRIQSELGLPFSDMRMHPTEPAVVIEGAGMTLRMRQGMGADVEAPELPPTIPIRKVSLETGEEVVLHEAWRPPRPEDGADNEISGRSAAGGRMMIRMAPQIAFEPRVHVAILRDGRYLLVDSTQYAIEVLGPDGTVERTLARPIEPIAVTEDIREKEKAARLAALDDEGGGRLLTMLGRGGSMSSSDMAERVREVQREQIESLRFADVIPVITRFGVEWSGRIWVERATAEPGAPGPIDVIDADGRYHGTISPDGPRIPAAFGPDGLVAYIEKDELDVQTVRTLRLRPIDAP